MVASRKPAVLRALAAVAETILPSIQLQNAESSDLSTFFEWSGSSDANSLQEVLRFSKRNLAADKYWGFTSVLWLLSTRLGTLCLAGRLCLSWRFPFILTFVELPVTRREKILQALALSSFHLPRQIFVSLKNVLVASLFSTPSSAKPAPWAAVLNYTNIVGDTPAAPKVVNAATQDAEIALSHAVTDLQELRLQLDEAQMVPFLRSRGFTTSLPVAGERELVGTGVGAVLKCDAVVVGSGAGGSVTAATLAKAGLSVVVLEKSSWTRTTDMTWQERQAWDSMYENGGVLMSEDGAVAVVAGSTLGGGTKVNWSGSLRTPDRVRQEWAQNFNLPAFTSDRFTEILDSVCERLGVNEGICKHSEVNLALKRGLESQQASVERYPRNCVGTDCSALCSMGCKDGMKMSGDVTFLADAVRNGARVLTSTYAKRVVRDKTGAVAGLLVCDGGRSTSVPHQPSLEILIKAPVVVASCGSIHSPALLLRSGIKGNNNVGGNLRLHPAAGIVAILPRTGPLTNLWKGAPMTVLSKHLSNRENTGYGGIILAPTLQPGMFVTCVPWRSGREYKELLSTAPRVASAVVVVRDTGSGRVTIDAEGRPLFQYWPNAFDQETILQGMELLAKSWVAAGAEKLVVSCQEGLCYVVDETHTEEKLKAFTDSIRHMGVRPHRMSLFSAHQMGTCAMGADPKTSVCDPQGQVWGVVGLYVADASIMPTCSGVNPMITTYAVAALVAQNIVEKFARGRKPRGPVAVNYE